MTDEPVIAAVLGDREFGDLVRGQAIKIEARYEGGGTIKMALILSDIGFGRMLQHIQDAIRGD